MKKKILIITTISDSLPFFKGQINVLKKEFDIELVSSNGKHMDEMCTAHNVIGHKIKMERNISIYKDSVSLLKLLFLFLKSKPYVVHGNTPKASFLSIIAAWLCRVPVRVYFVHGLRYQGEIGMKRKILVLMEKITCYFATNIISASLGVKKKISEDKLTSKSVDVIGNGSVNGIDLNYFDKGKFDEIAIKKEYNIKDTNFVFGFIGRLVKDKGINELVAVFSKLSNEYKNCNLLLVGGFEHDLDPLLPETLNELKTNEKIIYVGVQNDVRPFYTIMDVFVFPSYREGFGLVLMEASAMSVPSISSNIIGCNEIITNNENGFLIQTKNEDDLLEKMKFCINNPQILLKMSSNARQFVEEKFEQKKHWEDSLEYYKKITSINR